MKTTIEQIESALKNKSAWTIIIICPSPGAIIVINNAFIENITTYRKNGNGVYEQDKAFAYTPEAKEPLNAMIKAHNNSENNQKEAENFKLTC